MSNVIITGASRGLGLSLACRFIDRGDAVTGISRGQTAWKSARKKAGNTHFDLRAVDVTSESAVKKFAAAWKKSKRPLDILINNAGYGGPLARVEDLSLKEYDKLMTANLTSAFLMCKAFLPLFRKQKSGLIINISSMAGKRGVPRLFGYSASKYGIVALSQCVAKENEDIDLKCITVCPGGINTKMRADLFGKQDARRQQSPDFVAGVILDVVEERFPMVSGSDIIIRHGKIWGLNPLPSA